MKILISVLILIVFATSSFAQEKDDKNEHKKRIVVPNAVESAFSKEYPGEKGIWDKEKNMYEVDFKKNGSSMSALYDVNGNKTETEIDIKVSDLPAPAVTWLSNHFEGREIKESSMITKADGEVNYEAEVNGRDVIFNKEGKFLRTVKD